VDRDQPKQTKQAYVSWYLRRPLRTLEEVLQETDVNQPETSASQPRQRSGKEA
jgi:hypothetical protein